MPLAGTAGFQSGCVPGDLSGSPTDRVGQTFAFIAPRRGRPGKPPSPGGKAAGLCPRENDVDMNSPHRSEAPHKSPSDPVTGMHPQHSRLSEHRASSLEENSPSCPMYFHRNALPSIKSNLAYEHIRIYRKIKRTDNRFRLLEGE